jgi:hypothetical protein
MEDGKIIIIILFYSRWPNKLPGISKYEQCFYKKNSVRKTFFPNKGLKKEKKTRKANILACNLLKLASQRSWWSSG